MRGEEDILRYQLTSNDGHVTDVVLFVHDASQLINGEVDHLGGGV